MVPNIKLILKIHRLTNKKQSTSFCRGPKTELATMMVTLMRRANWNILLDPTIKTSKPTGGPTRGIPARDHRQLERRRHSSGGKRRHVQRDERVHGQVRQMRP